MARIIRWCVALFLGILVGAAVFIWPVRPLWQAGGEKKKRVLRISGDNRYLYSSAEGPGGPVIDQWDLDSGRLVKSVELQDLAPTAGRRGGLRLSLDCKTVFVGDAFTGMPGKDDAWHIHDAATGARRGIPVKQVGHYNPEADSKDGRWFWVYHGNRANSKLNEGLDIISQQTGERVLEIRPKNGLSTWSLHLAADGNTAAVIWNPEDRTKKDPPVVTILELPAGQEKRWFVLPNLRQGRVEGWDGRNLLIDYALPHPDKPDDNAYYLRRIRKFDVTREPLGEGEDMPYSEGEVRGTETQTFWDDGPDWVVYYRFVKVDEKHWLEEWREWLTRKLGQPPPRYETRVAVWAVNRTTGQFRYRLPFPVGYPATVSPDGKRLACGTADSGIAVYDLDPTPRWMLAVLAGAATTAGLLGLLWLLRRSATRRVTSPPHSPSVPA